MRLLLILAKDIIYAIVRWIWLDSKDAEILDKYLLWFIIAIAPAAPNHLLPNFLENSYSKT